MTCAIPATTVDAIRRHLADEYPREGCGLLVGRDRSDERRVEYAIPARNHAAETTRRYSIAPEEFLVAEQEARARGLEVVGFYHSHPDLEPEPSPSDAAEAWPHYTYLIVGVRRGGSDTMAAWRMDGRGFVHEALRVRDGGEGAR
jgi:proteasome lid subunit RPN8/RPN11